MVTLTVLLQAVTATAITKLASGLGAAITAFAAAYGIGKIGFGAMESIARQPEAAGDIRSSMIVSAALIEGVSFFAIVVCFVMLFT